VRWGGGGGGGACRRGQIRRFQSTPQTGRCGSKLLSAKPGPFCDFSASRGRSHAQLHARVFTALIRAVWDPWIAKRTSNQRDTYARPSFVLANPIAPLPPVCARLVASHCGAGPHWSNCELLGRGSMDLPSLAPVEVDGSASGSPCAGGCGCPAGGGASEVMAKVSLEAGDAGEVTPDIPAGPVDLETLLEHAAVQLSHQQHLPLSARHKIRSLLAQYDASTGELDRYAFFDSGKRYSEAGRGVGDTLMIPPWRPTAGSAAAVLRFNTPAPRPPFCPSLSPRGVWGAQPCHDALPPLPPPLVSALRHASSPPPPLTVTPRRLGRLTPATIPSGHPAPLPRVHRTPRGTPHAVGDRFTAPPTPHCPSPSLRPNAA
jgi:hypothetical protein